MPSSYQGASNQSGYVGSQPILVQPVSEKHAVPESVLTQMVQLSQEQLLLNQMRKLAVRPLVGMLGLRVNDIRLDASSPLKRP